MYKYINKTPGTFNVHHQLYIVLRLRHYFITISILRLGCLTFYVLVMKYTVPELD